VTALSVLDRESLDPDVVGDTLGVVLKSREDLEMIRGEKLAALLERSMVRA
jgi:hypothetical protein